ncbi:hypothetical protein [Budvicia aquatica]|uniref:Fumarase D n=1 Tax=Budvicia aquatica TaxID=82979 RepID=A0A2C6DQU3_9GAMM|nr:hypothetical protein [Budvicia aquatica]PHI31191.1 hypothetical protein CRN84_18525 [Budvicia aquatica]VFS51452.1 Uncharacterised protein [Budvicia aquatica]
MDKFVGYNDVCQMIGRAMLNLIQYEQAVSPESVILMLESYIQVEPDRMTRDACLLAIDALKGNL